MIQVYDYTKFYDKKVEVKINNETDLIQFLDYLKLLNRDERNYYETFDDYTPYYPMYIRVRSDMYPKINGHTYEWYWEYEPSEDCITLSYDEIIVNQDLNMRIENNILRNKAQSMERHALEAVNAWCNIKEVEKEAVRKIADISRKYGYTSTLAEIDKCTLNGANEIFNIFWQELEAKLEGDAELLDWYDSEYSRP